MEILKTYYSEVGNERIGFIQGNKIIEVPNISSEPQNTFMVSVENIIKYAEVSEAFWHTHPGTSCNLSEEDTVGIKNWSNLKHYIIGKDGVKCYQYNKTKKAILVI